MPCNCDYMDPTNIEVEMSNVHLLLDELSGLGPPKNKWNKGTHPKARGWRTEYTPEDNKCVESLCSMLKKVEDVKKYSLEMQIWWRNHKEQDEKRRVAELTIDKLEKDRKKALSKLTDYERKILGH